MCYSALLGGEEVDKDGQDDAEGAVEDALCYEGIHRGGQAEEDGDERHLRILTPVGEGLVVDAGGLPEAVLADDDRGLRARRAGCCRAFFSSMLRPQRAHFTIMFSPVFFFL